MLASDTPLASLLAIPGSAKHETTLGHITEVDVFEKVASNFKATGYGDTGSLQGALVKGGNAAAAKYPKLDRILKCAIVEAGAQEL